jgi:GNAT superfamily N-acetyltransferase
VQLRIHDDPMSFLADAGAFLRAAEAENSIIATPVAGMIAAPDADEAGAYLGCAVDRGRVIAAALHSSGGVLVTGGPEAAFELFAADMAGRNRRPRSVVGPLASCEAFARVWRERTGYAYALRFQLRHFALTDAPAAPRASGTMRLPERSEHELIADWQVAFVVEAGLPDDAARVRASLARRIERGLVRVWDDDGAVCFAGYAEIDKETGHGAARIAPVYTPPARRGCGYASALVVALSRELLGNGKRAIFLTTDLANPTSNSIYRKIGYRAVADHFHFDFQAAPAADSA